MNIGVLGLGYVGIVNVACFAKAGYRVFCSDVKKQKVLLVQNGKSPILEPDINLLLEEGIKSGLIVAVESTEEVIRNSDLILVCVGTPSKSNGEVNLSYLNNIVLEMASLLNTTDNKYIAFRSTVPPGTTKEVYSKYFGDRFPGVVPVFYPEFLREGSAIKDFYNYGRLVIGVDGKIDTGDLISVLHLNKEAPIFIVDIRTAEYSKYIDNSFHALKVTFANEIFGLASDLGVNVNDAYEIFVSDNKLNISKYYLRPGLPFGGSCLPKDLRELQYLIGKSKKEKFLLNSITLSNDNFIERLYSVIRSFKVEKISFIGVTFKNYSDDLRESPVLKLINRIYEDTQYKITLWDEDFNIENIRIEFPHLFTSILSYENAIAEAELIIVSKRYCDEVLKTKNPNQIILNLSDDQGIVSKNGVVNIYN